MKLSNIFTYATVLAAVASSSAASISYKYILQTACSNCEGDWGLADPGEAWCVDGEESSTDVSFPPIIPGTDLASAYDEEHRLVMIDDSGRFELCSERKHIGRYCSTAYEATTSHEGYNIYDCRTSNDGSFKAAPSPIAARIPSTQKRRKMPECNPGEAGCDDGWKEGVDRDWCKDPCSLNVATISAGFEKGDFLVREEQGNRVYFDFFDEAFTYISNKGYSRMASEDEKDWIDLMNAVNDKEGVKYNTGTLVMVLTRSVRLDRIPPPSEVAP